MCDYPAVYEETTRKARKKHRCCECRRPIQPGTAYVVCSGLWEGGWASYKRCQRCHRTAEALVAEIGADGWDPCDAPAFTELRSALRERIYNRHRWPTWAKAEGGA